MKSFDTETKQFFMDRAERHRKADEIVQGRYWDGKKGCCVGCLAEASDMPHGKLADDCGVDERIFHLADSIHEGLPLKDAKKWPTRFVRAIPCGVNTSVVADKFLRRMLSEQSRQYCDAAGKAATDTVIALLDRRIAGDEPVEKEWLAAARAADAAVYAARVAANAAWSAADAAVYAARAVRAAADAAWAADAAAYAVRAAAGAAAGAAWAAGAAGAAYAAAYAVRAAADAAAWAARAAAWEAARRWQADTLCEILEKTT